MKNSLSSIPEPKLATEGSISLKWFDENWNISSTSCWTGHYARR